MSLSFLFLGGFFWLLMGLAFSLLPFSLCLLILHVLMPKAVLDRYWKEPHFRPFELMLFSGWSFFAPMRTIMFMWMFLFPHAGRRRGILEPHRLVPRWYRITAIVMDVWMIIMFIVVGSALLYFTVYFYAIGDPRIGWDIHLSVVTVIACIAFIAIRQWRQHRRENKAKHERPSRRKKQDAGAALK